MESIRRIWNLTDQPIPVPCMENVFEKTFDSNDDPSTYPPFFYTAGDINLDGSLNITDLMLMIDVVFELEEVELTQAQFESADINNDGVIDINDITLLLLSMMEAYSGEGGNEP